MLVSGSLSTRDRPRPACIVAKAPLEGEIFTDRVDLSIAFDRENCFVMLRKSCYYAGTPSSMDSTKSGLFDYLILTFLRDRRVDRSLLLTLSLFDLRRQASRQDTLTGC